MATGAQSTLRWGLEDEFGVDPTTAVALSFGSAVEITSLDYDNDVSPRRGLGSRNFQKMGFGSFKGSMSLKFDLGDPFIFRIMTGGFAGSGTGTFTYTFAEADILPSFTVYDFVNNIDGGVDKLSKYLGCVVTDWSLDTAVGNEPVAVTLNIAFANVLEFPVTEQILIVPDADPLMFAHANWKKDATAIAKVESVSIKCNQGVELKPYLGSRFAQRAKFGDREYEVASINYYGSTSTYLQDFYGAIPNAGPTATGPVPRAYTLSIVPAAGQNEKTTEYTFTFGDGYATRYSQPKRVGEDIMEEVSIVPRTLTIIAKSTVAKPTGWI